MRSNLNSWVSSLLLLLLAGLVSACGPKNPSELSIDVDALAVFPAPPDTARIQFLTAIGTSRDVEAEESPSFLERLAGTEAEDDIDAIRKPHGIAVAPGKIYVCDSGLPGVEVIDLKLRTFDVLGGEGSAPLARPLGCATDPATGRLFVADVVRNEVVVFGPLGGFVTRIDMEGERPTGVTYDGESLWVAYPTLRRVVRYDGQSLEPVGAIPADPDSEDNTLALPSYVSVADGEVYVTDQGRFEVQVFSTEGEYLRAVGEHGTGLGTFTRPKDNAVSRDSILYVVDAAFQNVQLFNYEGQILMYFGGAYQGPGYMYLPSGIAVDYDNVAYFQEFVRPGFEVKYLIYVVNQFGPDKVSVYGFVGP